MKIFQIFMFNLFNRNKKVTERLYAQNLELSVKNKTLSLLEKLYQTSVLTLSPEQEAGEITDAIRKSLNLELVGIFEFKKETDSLKPLVFSKSDRLVKILRKLGFLFRDIIIKDIASHQLFRKVVYEKQDNLTSNIEEIWKELVTFEHLREVKKESHLNTMMLYPLIIDGEIFGVLLLGFNRDYQSLNDFEKASIKSFVNVIALLLDKAYLYKNLQDSYQVTKQAYAVEKKAKEDLENLDKTKNEFMLVTQHHLRTPLTSMMGYMDLIESGAYGKLPKKIEPIIHKFGASSQDLIKIVNEFLDASQFQLGKKVIVCQSNINIELILRNIVMELAIQSKEKGLYLDFEKPSTTIPLIEADPSKLQVALTNIIDNAIKYTKEGGIDVKIEVRDGNVQIMIKDTGIGMEKGDLDSIFNTLFSRSQEAKKANATGSGIGLYLSAKIIQAHNGKIWVESEGIGKGSAFYINLPIKQDKKSVNTNSNKF